MQVVLSLWYNMKPDTLSTAKAHPNVPATLHSTLLHHNPFIFKTHFNIIVLSLSSSAKWLSEGFPTKILHKLIPHIQITYPNHHNLTVSWVKHCTT
jgi:hypothetical protein